ncbi:MAG: hypothetical protein EA425_09235 [Puniceicoccaceae bacterium]|nr:MAG: hypothetical protein EA425_09235 [Puniceicoccaceae bacterium]
MNPFRLSPGWFLTLLLLAAAGPLLAQSLEVDPSSLEETEAFHRAVYHRSFGAPLGWTGTYEHQLAGATAAAHREAVLRRINYFRAFAGVPATITLDASLDAKAQQAAFLMSLNEALSHHPPESWTGWSEAAAEGALNSNLALGTLGPDAIDGYIQDHGAANAGVGHRRWLLFPQTSTMGVGDVPGIGTLFPPANATWVIPAHPSAPRPATREDFVAWPPPGHVPHTIVYPRWSFSHPDADFSAATVTMTRDGASIAAAKEAIESGAGEPTLVWVYDGLDPNQRRHHPRPSQPVHYTVAIEGVVIGGQSRAFNYSVTVFDPDDPAAAAPAVTLTGPAEPGIGLANAYSALVPSFLPLMQWRRFQSSAFNEVEGAEYGDAHLLLDLSGDYNVIVTGSGQVASGNAAFRLAHTQPRSQIIQLPQTFLAQPGASLSFRSRLAFATSSQIARVEASLDGGLSWRRLYEQAGSGAGESVFHDRTVDLDAFAGRTFQLRFHYAFRTGGSYYSQTTPGVGWYLDDIALDQVREIAAVSTSAPGPEASFTWTPSSGQAMHLQARGLFSAAMPGEWGAARHLFPTVVTESAPVFVQQPTGGEFAESATVTLTAAAEGMPEPSYQWFKDGTALAGATTAELILPSAAPADSGSYRVRATNSAGEAFSQSVQVTVHAKPGVTPQPAPPTYRAGEAITLSVQAHGADAFQWYRNGHLIAGATAATLEVTGSGPSQAGTYSVLVSGPGGSVEVEVATLAYEPFSRPVNLSTRALVGEGMDQMIAGFVLEGSGTTSVLVRGIGPGLSHALPAGLLLQNPRLELLKRRSDGGWDVVAVNTHWADAENSAALAESGFAPGHAADAAILADLPGGVYTARLRGHAAQDTGLGLVEVFMLDHIDGATSGPEPVNLSTRGLVGTGSQTMIGGFVVQGDAPKTVLIRGLGPGLRKFFAASQHPLLLGKPRLRIFNSQGQAIETNEGWTTHPRVAEIEALPFTPDENNDAAVLITLPPGVYTAQLSALENPGLGIIEVYVLED